MPSSELAYLELVVAEPEWSLDRQPGQLLPRGFPGAISGVSPNCPAKPFVRWLRERLAALPNFYRGGRAVLMLGSQPLDASDLAGITAILQEFGIIADGAVCDADEVATERERSQ